MSHRINIRKNDQVYVISGKDRGKTGRVMMVLPREEKVLVEGVNMVKKAVKSNPQKNTLPHHHLISLPTRHPGA